MRIPDAGPFGETRFDASPRAIAVALWLNSPFCGCVESVVTAADHFRFDTVDLRCASAAPFRFALFAFDPLDALPVTLFVAARARALFLWLDVRFFAGMLFLLPPRK
jgi:hypothetical protein